MCVKFYGVMEAANKRQTVKINQKQKGWLRKERKKHILTPSHQLLISDLPAFVTVVVGCHWTVTGSILGSYPTLTQIHFVIVILLWDRSHDDNRIFEFAA